MVQTLLSQIYEIRLGHFKAVQRIFAGRSKGKIKAVYQKQIKLLKRQPWHPHIETQTPQFIAAGWISFSLVRSRLLLLPQSLVWRLGFGANHSLLFIV